MDCNILPFHARLRGVVPRAHPSGNHDLETQPRKSHRVGAIQGTAACRASSGNSWFSIRKKSSRRFSFVPYVSTLICPLRGTSGRIPGYHPAWGTRPNPCLRVLPALRANAGTGGKKHIIKAARRARPQRTRQGLNPSRTRLPGGERGRCRGAGAGALGASPPRGGAGPPSARADAHPTLGAAGTPRLPVQGSGCGLGLSGRVSWAGGGRGGGRRSPRGDGAGRGSGSGCEMAALAAPPAPRGRRALHAAITKWRTRREEAAERGPSRRRPRPRAHLGPPGCGAGPHPVGAALGAVAKRKSRSRLGRASAEGRWRAHRPAARPAPTRPIAARPARPAPPPRAPPANRKGARRRGGERGQGASSAGPVGCGWGHGVSSNEIQGGVTSLSPW